MDRFQSMEIFVAAVEAGSFAQVAEQRRMSAPMIGKHIRDLEERLGAMLLNRTTRRQSLTEIGAQYYERCRQILADVRAAEANAEAMRLEPRGRLRISAPVTFGSLRLAPAIADYLALFPQVRVELSLDDRVVDLIDEGFDCVIRVGKLVDSGLIARQLAPYRMMICGSPDYLERAGKPRRLADLAAHQCLDFTPWRRHGGWLLGRRQVSERLMPTRRFEANNGLALKMAALQGLGLVMQAETLLAEEVAAGRLIEVLRAHLPAPQPMHLLYAPDRQTVPKLRSFVEFVSKRFGTGARRS